MSLSSDDKKKLEKFLNSHFMKDQVSVSHGWKNFMKTQETKDAIVINVESRMALHALMLEINALNKNKDPEHRIVLRAAAGGRRDVNNSASYSATECVNADIIIHLTGPDFAKIATTSNPNIMRVGASMQIGELDKQLYENHHLVLPTSSLIPYVTVAGLSAAGGHGTGKDQPSFAGLIRGVTLCTETGDIVHIDNTHPDFHTIMGANNGLFGIVLDVDIECEPRMKLELVTAIRSPIEFMEDVEKGLFDHDEYVSAMYVPTYLPDEMTNRTVNNVIVYRFRRTPLDTKNVNHTPILDNLEQKIQTDLGSAINIPEILRTYPKLVPFYLRHLASPLSIGDKQSLTVGPWYDLMHYRTAFPNDLDEICGIFPVKDVQDRSPKGKEIARALAQVINLLDEHSKRGEYPVTYALYFRYLQGTNGGLSFTSHPEGHHVCAMDITTNKNIKGYKEFERKMQDFFLNELQGKFHWGKNAPKDIDYAKLYGENWKETKSALERWHQTYGIKTEMSMLLNPLFSNVFGYPAPCLIDTHTLPATDQVEKKYHVAVNAQKLVKIIGNNSGECKAIKKEINDDIISIKNGSMFPKPSHTPEKDTSCICTIL